LEHRFLCAALCLCALAVAAPASAQIYTWTDGNGHLVLSDHPKGGAPAAYVVPQSESMRTTRSVDTTKSSLYDDLIRDNARLQGVRTDLVRAVVQVESGFNAWAKSPKGAMGLMQLMPQTMREFGVRDAFNPAENIRGGVAYLRQLLDRYSDNEVLALAAYNAGPGAVDKHGQTVPPYKETQDYVTKINKISARPVQQRGHVIYKITEIVDGQETVRYSDQKPSTGSYTQIGGR
jgi:soluble lytic murein transglycosylase-like protein